MPLGGASDAGVVQPGGESVEVRRAHRNAATLVVVMEALWKEHFWCLLPRACFMPSTSCKQKPAHCTGRLGSSVGRLAAKTILDTPFWGILTEGIQVPGHPR